MHLPLCLSRYLNRYADTSPWYRRQSRSRSTPPRTTSRRRATSSRCTARRSATRTPRSPSSRRSPEHVTDPLCLSDNLFYSEVGAVLYSKCKRAPMPSIPSSPSRKSGFFRRCERGKQPFPDTQRVKEKEVNAGLTPPCQIVTFSPFFEPDQPGLDLRPC